jgi:hypothetical protein
MAVVEQLAEMIGATMLRCLNRRDEAKHPASARRSPLRTIMSRDGKQGREESGRRHQHHERQH